jgi:hypothetical protein
MSTAAATAPVEDVVDASNITKTKRVATPAQLENLAKARAKSLENRKSLAELGRKEKDLRDAEVARRWKIVQEAEAGADKGVVVPPIKKKGPKPSTTKKQEQVLHVSPPMSESEGTDEEGKEESESESEDSEKEFIPRLSRRAQRASEKARRQVVERDEPPPPPMHRQQQQQSNAQLNHALRMLRMR